MERAAVDKLLQEIRDRGEEDDLGKEELETNKQDQLDEVMNHEEIWQFVSRWPWML